MKLTTIKSIEEMRAVLMDPAAAGPDPAYWVFREIEGPWKNMTIIPPGTYNGEFTKSVGHYHLNPVNDELYHCVSGNGVFVFQKKHFENGVFVPEIVEEVQIKRIKAGDDVKISGDFGHALVNIGDEPLITYDDRVAPHSPEDYDVVTRLHGLAYYVVKEGDKINVVPNPHYQNLSSAALENSL